MSKFHKSLKKLDVEKLATKFDFVPEGNHLGRVLAHIAADLSEFRLRPGQFALQGDTYFHDGGG